MISFSKLGQMGRLGNQLFQVAAIIGQAHKCNTEYLLPKWRYSAFFTGHINQGEVKPGWKTYKEPFFHYQPIPCMGEVDLQGYFQSIRYWEHCQDLIRELFSPVDEIRDYVSTQVSTRSYTGETLTAVHIRRGDYLKFPEQHTNLSQDYYSSALEIFKGPTIVFSDDIPWCKENFKADYYSEGNEIQDLFLFASCPNKIMANSSFSWWAAYLGGGKVIAPKQWFGEKLNHNTKDLYLPSWILK